MSHLSRRDLLAGAAVLAASSRLGAQPRRRPNILFLMDDQHRGDGLGAEGHPCLQTPHLDRLAAEGARYRCAYSAVPSCTPARAALLTGLSPWHNGMLGYGRPAVTYRNEMPRLLSEAGYFTTGIGKMHWHPQRNLHGFHQTLLDESGRVESEGFVSDYRQWFAEVAPELDPDATGIGWNDHRAWPYRLPEELHPTTWTADRAVEFIDGYQRAEPFFLKVSFARPHSPYDPPQRWWDAYEGAAIPERVIGDWADRFAPRPEPMNNNLWAGDLGPEPARTARRGYYANISLIDEQIGRILRSLTARGWLDETLILFVSDHGDMTGDHHLWRKTYPYEPSARVPLLLRWPGGLLDSERGQVRAEPVELRDILPTFLDAAGALDDPGRFDGRSLLGPLRGEGGWREALDLEHSTCYFAENYWHGMTDGRWKYVHWAVTGEEQLFDLTNDPGETRDLSTDPRRRSTLSDWRGRLIDHFAERDERFVKDGRLQTRERGIVYSPHQPGE